MPYLPEQREYRNFAASNFKPVTREAQLDDEGNAIEQKPTYKVRGYFTTFNEEYELYPATKYWPAEYEQIDRHALDDADMSDVIMQYDHTGPVMARIRNGSLEIGTDDHGAWCEADLSGCQQARDLYESIQNGLVVEMSFGFIIASDENGEGYTYTRDEDGTYHTTITRISKVFDCSAVGIPANGGTEIEEMRKRSYLADTIEADRKAVREERERIEAEERAANEAEEARARQESDIAMLRLRAKALDII